MVVFLFMGLYAVKFYHIVQNNVEYQYSQLMHYGKVGFESLLCILSFGITSR